MRLTKEQFAKIEHLMPIPRRKPEVSNYDFLCALLYIIENGCKWRGKRLQMESFAERIRKLAHDLCQI